MSKIKMLTAMPEKHKTSRSITLLLFLSLLCFWWPRLSFAAECQTVVAHAVSIQGRVEARSIDSTDWRTVQQGDGLCAGDQLRVQEKSRAGLYLINESFLRLGEKSSIIFNGLVDDSSTWVELLRGIAHFISRIKHSFQVNTPYVNAAIEGTEFTLEIREQQALISVMEGRVRAYNAAGQITLGDSQVALASPGQVPSIQANVHPRDAVKWALYYPPVSNFRSDFAETELNKSLNAYQRGDTTRAFELLTSHKERTKSSRFYAYRASLNLAVGRIDQAHADIAKTLTLNSLDADALALNSIIATVSNDTDSALQLAHQAIQANPQAAGPLLALSYALQARFELEKATGIVIQAITVEPDNVMVWSRLAQLHLMLGAQKAALEAAQHAQDLSPDFSQTQTTLGFAYLIGFDNQEAKQAFQRAAKLDQAAPLPRLGLGLTLIREGKLAEGRYQIEVATNLDPGNALIRSYLGKAYYEEKRSKLAGVEYELAKTLDPRDPTAWFYAAILQQTENHPVTALENVQTAITLNNNRAVYRSRLLLDEDQAARNASLARIYNDLGFEQLGRSQNWKSLAQDPGNQAAHRFLSDTYIGLPRHEIARVSEFLQAQLLQPETIAPVSPSAGEANLLVFQGTGPTTAGFNEFNPLFERKHTALLASGIVGSEDTRGGEIVAGVWFDQGMLSLGHFQDYSAGFHENGDSDQTTDNLFAQYRINSKLSIQGEYRNREGEFGDTALRFDPASFSTSLRRNIDVENWRLGINYSPVARHKFLVSLISQDLRDATVLDEVSVETQNEGTQYEGQYIYQGQQFQLLTGIGYLDLEQTAESEFTLFGMPFSNSEDLDVKQQTAHFYLHLPWSKLLTVIGFDHADIEQQNGVDQQQINPKLGLIWEPTNASAIRLAAFRTLRTELVNNQTIAPTQLAGFNQFFDDALGTEAWRYGIGYDQRLMQNLDGGIEFSWREITEPVSSLDDLDETQDEQSHRAYLYWTYDSAYAFSAEYHYEDFKRDYIDGEANPDFPAAMNTHSLALGARYFHPAGFFTHLTGSNVNQELDLILPTTGTTEVDDSFWITDASLGYRLPKRRGLVELQVRNLFDQEFHFQSIHPGTGTPLPSRYYPERSVFLQAQLWF